MSTPYSLLRDTLVLLCRERGNSAGHGLLREFGVPVVRDLHEGRWDEFIQAARELIVDHGKPWGEPWSRATWNCRILPSPTPTLDKLEAAKPADEVTHYHQPEYAANRAMLARDAAALAKAPARPKPAAVVTAPAVKQAPAGLLCIQATSHQLGVAVVFDSLDSL